MRLHTYRSKARSKDSYRDSLKDGCAQTIGWLRVVCVALVTSVFAIPAVADEQQASGYLPASYPIAALGGVQVKKAYALGIGRFDLDTQTEIIGWRLNDTWYFGRQDGLDSGLTLVWHQNDKQVSLSKDGVRLTRRF
jgi:hypothetical protein